MKKDNSTETQMSILFRNILTRTACVSARQKVRNRLASAKDKAISTSFQTLFTSTDIPKQKIPNSHFAEVTGNKAISTSLQTLYTSTDIPKQKNPNTHFAEVTGKHSLFHIITNHIHFYGHPQTEKSQHSFRKSNNKTHEIHTLQRWEYFISSSSILLVWD